MVLAAPSPLGVPRNNAPNVPQDWQRCRKSTNRVYPMIGVAEPAFNCITGGATHDPPYHGVPLVHRCGICRMCLLDSRLRMVGNLMPRAIRGEGVMMVAHVSYEWPFSMGALLWKSSYIWQWHAVYFKHLGTIEHRAHRAHLAFTENTEKLCHDYPEPKFVVCR